MGSKLYYITLLLVNDWCTCQITYQLSSMILADLDDFPIVLLYYLPAQISDLEQFCSLQ